MAGGGDEHVLEARRPSPVKRPKSSRHVSKQKDTPPPKPDLDELRSRRADYYARPERERLHDLRQSSDSAEASSSRKEKKVVKDDTVKRSSTRRRKDSVQGYVYTPPQPSSGSYSVYEHREPERDQPRESRKSKGKALASSEDVSSRPRPARTSSIQVPLVSVLRPALKRSQTTSARVVGNRIEVPREEESATRPKPLKAPSVTASRRTSRRQSGLFAPLLRSSTTPAATVPLPPRLIECLICASDDVPVHKSAKLPCGHRMCHSCLRRIFVLSTTDPAHMPPKCCTADHIPLKHVDALFDNRFKLVWNKKYQEYKTSNRLYCPQKGCGEWIKPSHIHADTRHPSRRYGLCKRCKTRVCATCNNKYHKRRECPNDPDTAAFIATAKDRGWQRCYSCKAMVELKEGCNHMTCRCTAEFCMLCAAQWKTCECPWFNHAAVGEGDRLRDMRVPGEPVGIPILRRRVTVNGRAQGTYAEELDARRRQEREDEALARRMQLEADFGVEGGRLHFRHVQAPAAVPAGGQARAQNRTRGGGEATRVVMDNTFGVGNGMGHFMNEDFVRNATNVVLRAFDEGAAGMGRRGERDSGRRRASAAVQSGHVRVGDPGLAPNAFGDASVLGAAGTAGLGNAVRSNGQTKKKRPSFTRIAKNGGAAQGGKSDRIRGWLANVE
ncbi:hypothetical protein B9Z65_4711 [Elsinoe australis]|uniref:RBR-type E3 ubiquitin transferase n=1 Tax=Elsinoe australis TaxID=40998 RepID=A0A2P8A5U2_9PEZI|nr:hypothetical protein B9Z65_4711 [Elsinoe australis]